METLRMMMKKKSWSNQRKPWLLPVILHLRRNLDQSLPQKVRITTNWKRSMIVLWDMVIEMQPSQCKPTLLDVNMMEMIFKWKTSVSKEKVRTIELPTSILMSNTDPLIIMNIREKTNTMAIWTMSWLRLLPNAIWKSKDKESSCLIKKSKDPRWSRDNLKDKENGRWSVKERRNWPGREN